jgi:hypothetical protein
VGQTQALQTIDVDVVRQIGSRFDRLSKAVLPERRERVRDVSPMARDTPGAAMMPKESGSPPPPVLDDPLSGVDAPSSHPESATSGKEGLTPVVVTTDQQPKQPLMADMIKFPEHIYLKAKELPADQRLKLAGQLAAEVLKRYPHLIQQLGSTNDPVPAWTILRNVVMRQLEQRLIDELAPEGQAY